jgi:uncharacterized protein (TIGR02246 family)
MDHAAVQAWLDRYIEAWRSNDAETIGALFTDDAVYSYGPMRDDDLRGRDEIVKSWLEAPDQPSDWDAHYAPHVVEGDRAVATGWSRYYDSGGSHDTPRDEYANVYLLEFGADGRCSDFREFFMQDPKIAKKQREERTAEAVEAARAEWQKGAATAAEARRLSETREKG